MSAAVFFLRAVIWIALAVIAGILLALAQDAHTPKRVRVNSLAAFVLALALVVTLWREWVIL